MRAINQPSRKHRRQIDFTADSFIGIVFQFSVQCAQKREPFIKHNENIMLFAATHVHAREYLRGHTSRSRLSCSPGRKTKYTLEYIHRRRWGSRKKNCTHEHNASIPCHVETSTAKLMRSDRGATSRRKSSGGGKIAMSGPIEKKKKKK